MAVPAPSSEPETAEECVPMVVDPLPPPEYIWRLDVECRYDGHLQKLRLPVVGHQTAAELLERLISMVYGMPGTVLHPRAHAGPQMTAAHVIAVAEYLRSFREPSPGSDEDVFTLLDVQPW
ncbi:unnamed protein product [Symbiodinium sp. CCMP2592]|nr:unnamed protein product [Symbiodinium sp. CCMP2592]